MLEIDMMISQEWLLFAMAVVLQLLSACRTGLLHREKKGNMTVPLKDDVVLLPCITTHPLLDLMDVLLVVNNVGEA